MPHPDLAPRSERLEARRLLAATLSSSGALTVTATAAADIVGLRADGSALRVVVNAQLSKFPLASVKSISIDLGDGDDRLDVGLTTGVYALGGLGDDTINGGVGSDSITAGGGRDSVDGGWGDDRIDGGPTADTLFGNDGADRLYGADANDALTGGAGVDRLFAGAGNDSLVGGASNDKLYGDDGNDTLAGNNQNDLLTGGEGDDSIFGGDGNDTLTGQGGDDDLQGQLGYDTAYGDAGDDALDGGGQSDSLLGGADADTLAGSDGDDTCSGDGGDDALRGDAGKDNLLGGDGADALFGGDGRDALIGGAGNDGLFGGRADADTLTGGGGADRFLDFAGDHPTDRAAADAAPTFIDGDVAWDDAEIEAVDEGFARLVERTNSTRLLKLEGGGDVDVLRYTDLGESVLADNLGDGRMRFGDLAFDSGDAWATMIHELGHNWDTDDENPSARDFFELSHWRDTRGDWTYDPDAAFANDYGKTNPYEDFATALEVYFSRTRRPSEWQAKWDYIDEFLDASSA
ncbi:MAG TPA: calcium-binding protein [Tepidisphaeraceae bacterium]|nr:calcium-binding protein [Tepidisphaeraceae bacterium]